MNEPKKLVWLMCCIMW